MDEIKFNDIYHESRNGANEFFRHPLTRGLIYSDGVQELAELGCYWLLDLIGTEVVDFMRKHLDEPRGQISVKVDTSAQCRITLSLVEGLEHWVRVVPYTDLPVGDWIFFIGNDDGCGRQYSLILPSEY